MTTNSSERGIVLVAVLWVVASMALLVSAFNTIVRSSAAVITSERISLERRAVLESGLDIVVAQLLADENARTWPRDGSVRELQIGKYRLRVSALNAAGLIDLNQSDEALLVGFLEQVTGSQSDAAKVRDRILDWRDKDNRRRFRGAEDFNYERAGRTYGAGDTDFVHISQLRDVLGISAALYRRMASYVTVFNPDGRINPQVAPKAVLTAVPGVSEADAERIVERAQEAATGEDVRRASTGLTQNNQLLTRELAPVTIVKLKILGAKGARTVGLEAAVMPGADEGAPYRVLSWQLARSWLEEPQG